LVSIIKSHGWLKQVKQQASEYSKLTDKELRDASLDLAHESRRLGKLAPLLVQGFALVQTAATRQLSMTHYDVQLIGGRAMCQGHVAEMRTGEGKTLTATLPLYMQALGGRGALLATANDYLAKRDAEWMQPVYQSLGMTIGIVQENQSREHRRAAYACDITYGTMKEFGFDFLRDHSLERQVQRNQLWYGNEATQGPQNEPVHRDPYFILVDEADSILIDDARTPMIISSAQDESVQQMQTSLYMWSAKHAPEFLEDDHYWYDREKRSVDLTPDGTAKVREVYKPDELAGTGLLEMYDFMERAIQVHRDYHRDREYVVRDGEVAIVDEATGRISEGRRWSRGIHQAIEAKENLDVTVDTHTQAKVTVQSFVNRFPLISGMTGTAYTSAREFKTVYKMPTSVIPTNRKIARVELPVLVAKDQTEKWNMIVENVKEVHAVGRPILIGTRSIGFSEGLSQVLTQYGIEHEVLNARQIEREAEIVSRAGEAGRVTVATNMAGRGTDIKITDEIRELGGLHVIGTELHESARIDNQLFGRCGRQGDPGTVQQYVAWDDQLLETAFGVETASKYRKSGKSRSSRWWTDLFHKAQKKVEDRHYRSRKVLMYNEKMLAKSQREMGLDPILDNYD
jgi:preprotein translocase subunit SecA